MFCSKDKKQKTDLQILQNEMKNISFEMFFLHFF